MPGGKDVVIRPVADEDVGRVADYLHRALNPRLDVEAWAAAIVPSWVGAGPNHGFMLLLANRVVGVNVAYYATREVAGETRTFCNVAALCVDEPHRLHTVRLIRALLRQPGLEFTDFSPSGNVVELDRRLGFRPLEHRTWLVANLPTPTRGTRVVTEPDEIARLLVGTDRQHFEDHRRALAAHHLVLVRGARTCYVVYRRDRRKGLPLFATILHVSDAGLFRSAYGAVAGHLLRRGAVASILESRVADVSPPLGRPFHQNRPKMVKSSAVDERDVDYLYSELTCVPW
ncbi:hypothetical protein [Microlunatus flavus]|uniref:hypothetical protein n=1 Tax=Microlunatus flavus TaxID=1036181 RepID=UPI0018E06FC3|nr:hypothetical protein [Microlunatus flavus]